MDIWTIVGFLAVLVILVLLWKIIKFGFKIFLVIVAVVLILFALDYIGVFDFLRQLFTVAPYDLTGIGQWMAGVIPRIG